MNNEEFMKLCEEFKAQGLDDKDILNVIYQMFKDEKIEKDEMVKMANSLGFELSEEFQEEAKGSGDEDLTPEEVEDAQEVESEDKEEESEKEDSDSEKEDSEDEEDEKSWKKNFGLD